MKGVGVGGEAPRGRSVFMGREQYFWESWVVKSSLIQDRKRLLPAQGETAASVYYGCLALLGHKAMPVCPMSHMGEIGRRWLGGGELAKRICV